MAISIFISIPYPVGLAILLLVVGTPVISLLMYFVSRRRVWAWLGGLSGGLLLLCLGIVVLFQEYPFQYIELMEFLFG